VATHHSTGSKQLFQIGSFFGSFRVPNFRGRFEALNDIFLGIAWARREIATLHYCSSILSMYSSRDLSNGPSNDPNGDRMQKLCPREVGLPIYHFGVNKTVGVSSSRVFLLPCFMLKGYVASL
jgi:hypothetical protein